MAGLWKHFQDGGWGMYPIVLWSIITIGIIVERALYLFGSSINKDVFLATMQKCILAGDVAKAVKMCSAANAPLARIVQAGLVKVNRPDEEVQAAMDEAALREIPKIAKRTGYLALLANLAMLSGLLGTVAGLIKCFGAVGGESVDPSQKARILAEGISRGHELHRVRSHRRHHRPHRLRRSQRQDPGARRRHQRGVGPGAEPRRHEPPEGQPRRRAGLKPGLKPPMSQAFASAGTIADGGFHGLRSHC